MKHLRALTISFVCILLFSKWVAAENPQLEEFLKSPKGREEFISEVSRVLENGWKRWQDQLVINGVAVDSSRGVISVGDVEGELLTLARVYPGNDTEKPKGYSKRVNAVLEAVENGMRLWQRGYTNDNIIFPEGASCLYTLTPSENVPVEINTGGGSCGKGMDHKELYSYILYRIPAMDEESLAVFDALSYGISHAFDEWKKHCRITGITASGGVAPRPVPMGNGPGPVSGASGSGGKLAGAYLEGAIIQQIAEGYLNSS